MNGMILAAGLGSRLAPLTDSKPKALVKVGGRPLLEWAIEHFIANDVDNIVVNVHHFADQVIDFIDKNRSHWNADIAISDERDELLETGGGLAKALSLYANNDFIVVGNVDVLSNASIKSLVKVHNKNKWDATLLTSHRLSTRNLVFDSEGLLCGWVNKAKNQSRMVRTVPNTTSVAFNGFHVIEQHLAKQFLPPHPLPIISAYLDNANDYSIGHTDMSNDNYWFDIGTTAKLALAEEFLFG